MTGVLLEQDEPTRSLPAAAASDGLARSTRGRTILAGVVLLCIYAVICAAHDPRGSLGTDTGGKLATIEAMRGSDPLDPDIGYWAERTDPDGHLHPLYYTAHIDGRWVNVTTLPMIVAAQPLAELGGLRAVMLLPMLGGLLCAYAGAALASRMDARARWPAFWILGLATPVVVYATDFWEHSLGLGFLLLASVACYDVALRRRGFATAAIAGASFGAAATMRTEALVYFAVGLAVVVSTMLLGRQGWRDVGRAIVGIGTGAVAVLVANQVLERAILGSGLRADRAAGTAADVGSTVAIRAKEAVIATVGLNAFDFERDILAGALVVGCIALGTVALLQPGRSMRLGGVVAFVVAAFVYVARMKQGAGFVPGLLTASPFAVVALVTSWGERSRRFVLALACVPIPVIWASQYSGGALPQWGARYELLSGSLLVVLGVVALVRVRPLFGIVLGLAIAVTAFGVVFTIERSERVAAAMEVVIQSKIPVISREGHVLREGGAFYAPTARWLTAESNDELDNAVAIVTDENPTSFEILQFHGRDVIADLDGFEPVRTRVVEFVPGVLLDVVTYSH